MTLRNICGLLALTFGLAGMHAADLKTEEMAIRALISKGRQVPYSDDAIRWSGADKRPWGGALKREPFPEVAAEKRKNVATTANVQRIEVAASGDMAYEFSNAKLEYDSESLSKHVAFEAALLRVWKKVDGKWKAVAMFVRPLDIPFVQP